MAKKTKQNGVRTFQESIAEWRSIADKVRKRAVAVDDSTHDRGWAMAATVGIPRCGCSLHNASIDDAMTGWCKGNPERLRVAKRANHLVNNWDASRIADKVIKSAWNRLMSPHGCANY
jgi:hypothetical protein